MDYSYTVCNHHMFHCQLHRRTVRCSTFQCGTCSFACQVCQSVFFNNSMPTHPPILPSSYIFLSLLFFLFNSTLRNSDFGFQFPDFDSPTDSRHTKMHPSKQHSMYVCGLRSRRMLKLRLKRSLCLFRGSIDAHYDSVVSLIRLQGKLLLRFQLFSCKEERIEDK